MKKNYYNLILLSLILLINSQLSISNAQGNLEELEYYGMDVSGVWRQVAPGMAGSNRAIYADKADPLKLWATPDMGNDYISEDGGKHWVSVIPPNGVWTQRKTLSDECVVSDPKNNKVVLSLNKKDIYVSTDGGWNFDKIISYASGSEPNSVWYTATAHPTEADVWYVANGLDNKYLRTGVNSNPLNDIDVSQAKVWKITNLTTSARTIEAIPNSGMDASTAVFDIFCHPNASSYPDMLFAATSTGLYRKDGVNTDWTKILDGCTKADYQWNGSILTVFALKQVNYTVNGTSLLSDGGVFKTSQPETANLSAGWTDKTSELLIDLTQLDIKKNYYEVMVKSWFGYTSGEEKSIAVPSVFLQDYSDILCDPTDAKKVYLSVWGGSILKPIVGSVWATNNGGDSWFAALRLGAGFAEDAYWAGNQAGKTNRNLEPGVADHKLPDFVKYENRGLRSMAIGADGTVYAAAIKGYHTYKYDVGDDHWVSLDNTLDGDLFYGHGNNDTGAFGVIPDIHNPGEMFILQYEASAYKSTPEVHPEFPGIVGLKRIPALVDIGPTWAPGQPLMTPITMANHPSNPDIFYAMSARTGEFAKITNKGNDYTVMGEPIEVPDVLNVSQMKCIYWSDLRIASDGKTMYAIAEIIDTDNRPMGQTKIYNPEPQKGIYKSTNEGQTWTCVNTGLPVTSGGRNTSWEVIGTNSASVKALVMHPINQECLYAAVKRYRAPAGTSGWVDGGLYRSTNGSQNWNKVVIPSGIKSVWDVWLHILDGTPAKIFIAGGGEGAEADWGEGGVWVADYKEDAVYQESDWSKIFTHPFVSHVRTSPDNINHLLIVTRESTSNNKQDAGTFFSLTGGSLNDNSAWTKFNEGRGGMMIGDISFDSGNPNRVWCACESSGVYTGLLSAARLGDVDSIKINHEAVELKINEKVQLESSIYPLGITPNVSAWKSLDESIATVGVSGEVTLLADGKVGIVAYLENSDKTISDTCWISQKQDIGINTAKYKQLQFYPNPVKNGMINIKNVSKSEQFVIYDVLGKKIIKGKLNGDVIDVNALVQGMYFIIVDDKYMAKFVKA